MRKTIILLLLFTLSFGGVNAQWHNQGLMPIRVTSSLVEKTDTVALFLRLNIDSEELRLYNLKFNFFSQATYLGSNATNLPYLDSLYLGGERNVHYLKFNFNKKKVGRLMKMKVFNYQQGESSNRIMALNEAKPFILFDEDQLPVVGAYLQSGDYSIMDTTKLIGFYYNHDFSVALPPMVTRSETTSKAMEIDSTFSFSESIMLNKKGLYLFQKDTTDLKALALRLLGKRYPKFTTVEELTQPLIYITDDEEQQKIDLIRGDKKRFDKFWIDLAEEPGRALRIIKTFYGRVEEANRRFTTFKQGWQTDMGMIFIVMGAPDGVERIGNKEIWNYKEDRHLPVRKYQFIKTNTIFSPAHYVLIREKKHSGPWFEAIDLLRKGIFK